MEKSQWADGHQGRVKPPKAKPKPSNAIQIKASAVVSETAKETAEKQVLPSKPPGTPINKHNGVNSSSLLIGSIQLKENQTPLRKGTISVTAESIKIHSAMANGSPVLVAMTHVEGTPSRYESSTTPHQPMLPEGHFKTQLDLQVPPPKMKSLEEVKMRPDPNTEQLGMSETFVLNQRPSWYVDKATPPDLNNEEMPYDPVKEVTRRFNRNRDSLDPDQLKRLAIPVHERVYSIQWLLWTYNNHMRSRPFINIPPGRLYKLRKMYKIAHAARKENITLRQAIGREKRGRIRISESPEAVKEGRRYIGPDASPRLHPVSSKIIGGDMKDSTGIKALPHNWRDLDDADFGPPRQIKPDTSGTVIPDDVTASSQAVSRFRESKNTQAKQSKVSALPTTSIVPKEEVSDKLAVIVEQVISKSTNDKDPQTNQASSEVKRTPFVSGLSASKWSGPSIPRPDPELTLFGRPYVEATLKSTPSKVEPVATGKKEASASPPLPGRLTPYTDLMQEASVNQAEEQSKDNLLADLHVGCQFHNISHDHEELVKLVEAYAQDSPSPGGGLHFDEDIPPIPIPTPLLFTTTNNITPIVEKGISSAAKDHITAQPALNFPEPSIQFEDPAIVMLQQLKAQGITSDQIMQLLKTFNPAQQSINHIAESTEIGSASVVSKTAKSVAQGTQATANQSADEEESDSDVEIIVERSLERPQTSRPVDAIKVPEYKDDPGFVHDTFQPHPGVEYDWPLPNGNWYECEICGDEQKFIRKNPLMDHYHAKHYYCEPCDVVYEKPEGLIQHLLEGSRHNYCEDCNQDYATREAYARHMKRYHPPPEVEIDCPGCHETMPAVGLLGHLESGFCAVITKADFNKARTIETCLQRFSLGPYADLDDKERFDVAEQAERIVLGDRAVICALPMVKESPYSVNFDTKLYMKTTNYGRTIWKCPYEYCEKNFKTVQEFIFHMKGGHWSYGVCPGCFKQFNSATAIFQHMVAGQRNCRYSKGSIFGHAIACLSGGYLKGKPLNEVGSWTYEASTPQNHDMLMSSVLVTGVKEKPEAIKPIKLERARGRARERDQEEDKGW